MSMAVFTERMLPEVTQRFWAALQRGEFITDAAAEVGTYRKEGCALGGRGGRCASSSRPESEGPLLDVLRA